MRVRHVLLLVAVSLLTAACASGASSSASSSVPTVTSPGNANTAADKALAEQALLKLSDFPTGWTSKPSSSGGSPDIYKRFASCLHTSLGLLTGTSPRGASSPDFSYTNQNSVSNRVGYESSPARVDEAMNVLREPQLPSCLESALNAYITYTIQHPTNPNSTLPSGVSVGNSTVAQMSFPNVGDQSIAYRVTVPVNANGLSIDIYVDLIAFVKGRAGVEMLFEAVGSPFDSSMEQQLTTLTEGRLTST